MEPMSVIAAVTAASNAIGFIKARINDVQSVSEISEQIGTLFTAQQKLNEERNKQAGVSDISLKNSIDATVQSKLLAESMQEISTLINLRFPKPADQPSTWQEILNHHNQALREQKEARRKAQIEARRKRHQMEENIKAALLAGVCIAIGAGALVLMVSFITRV